MSNAAIRLGFGIGGAVLGAWTGIGANVGFLAGSLIGGAFFPDEQQGQTATGPRLGDLSVSASTYGSMINIGFGTLRMPGNMIWTSGIREQENRTTVSAGAAKGGLMGGGPSQTQITYTYFASFAMSFGEGPADAVLRIWADTKLIYDRRNEQFVQKPGLKFRFYKGNETQLPDPLIESHKGAGRVPAHRGLVYIVFEDFDLTDFGNRIPNITAEIAFSTSDASSARASNDISTGEGGIYTSYQTSSLYIDRKRRRAFLHGGGPSGSGWRIYNLTTFSEIIQKTWTDASAGTFGSVSMPVLDKDGFIYGNSEGAANNQTIVKVDPNTLAVSASFSGGTGHAGKYEAIRQACIVHQIHPVAGTKKYHVSWSFFNKLYVLNADTMAHVFTETPTLAATFRGISGGLGTAGNGVAWLVAHSTGNTDIYIYKLTIDPGANYDSLVGGTIGVTGLQLVATLTPSQWGGGALSTSSVVGPIIDESDGAFIFMIDDAVSGWSRVFKWSESTGVVWTSRVNTAVPVDPAALINSSSVTDNKLGWLSTAGFAALIDTTDGSVLVENYDAGALLPAGTHHLFYYEGASQSVVGIVSTGSAIMHQYFIGRAAGESVPLSTIIDGISDRVGLSTVNDIDTSELVQPVRGYAITRQSDARALIDPLASAFLFDGVESDDKIKFKVRGRDPERTITRDNLIPLNNETLDVIEEQRVQEPELPRRLYMRFWDFNQDYQQNAVSARRVFQPTPTMRSRDERSVEIPIVLTPTEAKQIVEKWLFTVWNERNSFKFFAPFEHQDLDPADVVTLITGSGATLRTRITKATINVDLSVNFEGTAEDKLSVVSTATGQGGLGFPQKPPPGPQATQLFMLDTTLLRDIDDLAGTASRLYFAMAGYESGWQGGTLFQSADGAAYTNTGLRITEAVTYGVVTNKLPTTTTPFQTDTTTQLRVALVEGALASVTQTEFLNDANAALVGHPSTGWELILFKDAVEEADGVYLLSTIMRGRRGTETFCNSHVNGEYFIFLERATISSYRMPTADLDQQDFYKGVGDQQIPEDADVTAFTSIGRDMMPYAPCHLAAVVDGGSNIDLSWVRRTRMNGELRDLLGTVPLNEATEEYEVEIMDGSTVKRTFTGITTTSKQYDNADIITDFGSVPASLKFRVYQISAVVGRGFMAETTITF